jgi:micrococcal nuclease
MRKLVATFLCAVAVAGCGDGGSRENATVARILDGDTIELADGERVRLVQIDAPERSEGECYAEQAASRLERLVPPGSEIRLENDAALDAVDRFGRLLRYVFVDGENVNLELASRGSVGVYFFEGARGRYADDLLAAARAARAAGRGLWGACSSTPFAPTHQVDARR